MRCTLGKYRTGVPRAHQSARHNCGGSAGDRTPSKASVCGVLLCLYCPLRVCSPAGPAALRPGGSVRRPERWAMRAPPPRLEPRPPRLLPHWCKDNRPARVFPPRSQCAVREAAIIWLTLCFSDPQKFFTASRRAVPSLGGNSLHDTLQRYLTSEHWSQKPEEEQTCLQYEDSRLARRERTHEYKQLPQNLR